jgi:hypothetical protein
MKDRPLPDLPALAARFGLPGRPLRAQPWGQGHIHRSWRLDAGSGSYLLQEVNRAVFPDVEGLMGNVQQAIAAQQAALGSPAEARRRSLSLLPAQGGRPWWEDEAGRCWRLFLFIEGSRGPSLPPSPAEAAEAAAAFGRFLLALAPLAPGSLRETLPRFHDLSLRVAQLEEALLAAAPARREAAREALARAARWQAPAQAWIAAAERLPRRPCHNDAKLDNVLFDRSSGEALCVVDLDTVMPGLALFDYGDLMRSAAADLPEDSPDWPRMRLRREVAEALHEAYLRAAQPLLSPAERESLRFGPGWMAYLMALRFLADFLRGDIYYAIRHPRHNLDRAENQLRLLELLEG